MMTLPEASRSGNKGFSMLELMVAMAVLAALVVMLAEMFAATAASWVRKASSLEADMEVQIARQWLTEDLSSAYSNRPLRSSGTANFTGTEEQARFFRDRLILPFEVNRESGYGSDRSIENAEEGFDTLAFVALRSGAGSILPETFAPSRFGNMGNPKLGDNDFGTEQFYAAADSYLVAYYVAYTRDSPLPGATSSMKLYRHFRPCGSSDGEGQASAILRFQTNALGGDLLPRGQFRNQDLPYLFAFRSETTSAPGVPESAIAPWPSHADPARLSQRPKSIVPPTADWTAWHDPKHSVHDHVYGDEPIANNVVRFEVTPSRRVEIVDASGVVMRVDLMDARDMNNYLQLGGQGEWPALVVPGFVEVTLTVVGPDVAAKLEEPEDWVMNWGADDLPTDLDSLPERVVRRGLRTVRFRVPIDQAS